MAPAVDHNFFNICGGPKSPAKKKILNSCLTLCGMKWKNEGG